MSRQRAIFWCVAHYQGLNFAWAPANAAARTVNQESSWASVRDKLLNGELDAAHVLYGLVYGLVYGVQMGVGAARKDMAVLMNLDQNGQAVTLKRRSIP